MGPFELAKTAVHFAQVARVAIPFDHPDFLPACTVEIAARAELAELPEQQAELAAWPAKMVEAIRRRRLQRAMTPARCGRQQRPGCA
jgi:hypothetical protein